jgi:hypothetical protein
MLPEPEAKALPAAYGIPVVNTRIAATIEEAVRIAPNIGFPVALKILSPDVTHKSDVGGVALDLENAEAVDAAATVTASPATHTVSLKLVRGRRTRDLERLDRRWPGQVLSLIRADEYSDVSSS